MIFFYELVFVLVAIVTVFIGEVWSRSIALGFIVAWFALTSLAYLSFRARLAAANGTPDAERRWFTDARDGLRHLMLLFGLGAVATFLWQRIAG